jgi:putative membrane protein
MNNVFLYVKALHIIFIVTWFAGLFYMPRLLIYNTEAGEKSEVEKNILRNQFGTMMKRLWYGITWPSAILTLVFGGWMWYLLASFPQWLLIKLCFVAGLYLYHFSLQILYTQQSKGIFTYSSHQLRIWNEVATVFLVVIVMIVAVKQNISVLWGIVGLVLFVILLMSAIRIYKLIRARKQ